MRLVKRVSTVLVGRMQVRSAWCKLLAQSFGSDVAGREATEPPLVDTGADELITDDKNVWASEVICSMDT